MVGLTLVNYFEETKIPLRLACNNNLGWPVVLSLWYLYEDGHLYCATPQNAKVVSYLLAQPRCAYEVAADQPPYCGVRGQAIATIDSERGIEILERLLIRYLGSASNPLAKNLLKRSDPEVAIRLELLNAHTWDFRKRMRDSVPAKVGKVCPG